MTKPQVILDDNGNPAFAVIPWRMYKRLTAVGTDTDLSDEELHDSAKYADEESFPIDMADRLLAGESAVKAYRGSSWNDPETTSPRRPVSMQSIFRRSKEADVPAQLGHWPTLLKP